MATLPPAVPQEGPSLSIPPIGHSSHIWVPSSGEGFSRSELRRQTGQYLSAIPASIAAWKGDVDVDLVVDLEEATRALVVFDEHSVSLLGADNPALGPMSAILLRTESASSSHIEQLTTSAKQLALAELKERSSAHATTVVGNVRAMEAALDLAENISVESIVAMQRALLEHQHDMKHHAGVLRDQLVWIGPGNAGPLRAHFVAPQPDIVPAALQDLEVFMRREDLPVLLQVAIAHAQFATIHPFADGNGRTGRALAQSLLRNKGVVSHVTVPLSAGLLRNTSGYFDALQVFRQGDAGPIVRQFANAARFAASSGIELVNDLFKELERSREKLTGVRPQAAAWKVLPRLVGQPVISIDYVAQNLNTNKVTAQRAIDVLVEKEILREITGQRRNRAWLHEGILSVLDTYAEGLRRIR